jgi:hypothetical protein
VCTWRLSSTRRELPEDGNLAGSGCAGSLSPMTGGRVLPLLVGLWACSAFGQATVFTATASIKLDGGASFARAYVVTGGTATEYAMANAGQSIQVFDTNGTELLASKELFGTIASFAVANNVINGASTTTTLVAVGDVTSPACTVAMCLRIYFWDPTNGFVLQNTAPTTVLTATAMAIDTSTSPLNVYYASIAPQFVYDLVVNINSSTGSVTFGASNSRAIPSGAVEGLTVDAPSTTLYLSDGANNLYTFPANVTNLDGGIFARPTVGGYSQIEGIFYVSDGAAPYLLAGGEGSGVYQLSPTNAAAILLGNAVILAADAGPTNPSAASINAALALLLVTEDNTGSGAYLHLVDVSPAAGDGGGDAGVTDAGTADSGIPTIPIVPPGPGVAPPPGNSCNCSSAGSAPLLLVLLLPLLAPRRRR